MRCIPSATLEPPLINKSDNKSEESNEEDDGLEEDEKGEGEGREEGVDGVGAPGVEADEDVIVFRDACGILLGVKRW